jgi:hypothetical protein
MEISGEPGTYKRFWMLRPNESVLEAGLWGEWQKGAERQLLTAEARARQREDLKGGELSQNLHE